MLTHPTLDQLRALKLDGMAQAFVELEAQEETRGLAHAEWLGLAPTPRPRQPHPPAFPDPTACPSTASQPSRNRGRRLPDAAPARQSAVPAIGHLPLDRRAPRNADPRPVRRGQVVAILRAGA